MKRLFKILRFLLLSLFILGICKNLNATIRFRSLNNASAFPGKSIKTIIKDSLGFMWFGSYENLIRYDGEQYVVYENQSNDSTTPANQNVFALYIDETGNMWTGGTGGLSLYLNDKDYFKRYTEDIFSENTVHAISSDLKGNLWLCTQKGIFIYNRDSDKFIDPGINDVAAVIEFKEGNFYIGTEQNGLYIIDADSRNIIRKISPSTFSNFESHGLAVMDIDFDNENIWFTTSNGGLYKYSETDEALKKYKVIRDNRRLSTTFFSIEYINDNEILIGTQNEGFICFNAINETYEFYLPDKNSKFSLPSKTVRCIYRDDDENIWLGTNLGGVCYYNYFDNAVEHYTVNDCKDHWLSHDIISSFSEDANGNIWISTDGGGVNIFNPNTKSFMTLNKDNADIPNNLVDITKDQDGNMWAAPWHDALKKIDVNDYSSEVIFYDKEETDTRRSWNDFKGLYTDSKGRVWAFPLFRSPLIFEPDGSLHNEKDRGAYPEELFKIPLLNDAVEDKKGNIWLYGFEDLGILYPDNTLKVINKQPSDSFGILSTNILNIYVDSKNDIWISTREGFEKYSYKENRFIHISKEYDFPKKIYAVQEDKSGYLWFTSSEGLCRFHPDSMQIQYFEKNTGLKGDDFVGRSCFTAKDSTMYFGSLHGFIAFKPEEMHPNPSHADVLITSFSLYNKSSRHTDSLSPLEKPVWLTDTLVVEYRQNILGFHFAAMNYVASDYNKYAYRLAGFDNSWNFVKNKRDVTYTNLDPGIYRLQVKASNNEYIWCDKIKTLTIIVTPPWWKTGRFRLAVVILLTGILVMVHYIRSVRLKQIKEILEQKVNERTADLLKANNELKNKNSKIERQKDEISHQNVILIENKEEIESQKEELKEKNRKLEELNKTKDKFFSIIAHDLKNPLTALMGLTEFLYATFDRMQEGKKKEFAKTINNSSRSLYNLLENLLEWSGSQSGNLPFILEEVSINSLINANISLLKQNAKDKDIKLVFTPNQDYTFRADSNMLKTTTRNILSNAIKFTPRGGKVQILTSLYDAETLLIEIKDSGVGMSSDKLGKIFKIETNRSSKGTENETGTGLGLILCKEFVEKHEGSIWAESQPGAGSSFFIKLPLHLSARNAHSE